jgi:2-methylisocitrate lyase-like PEP mutase family enzyme
MSVPTAEKRSTFRRLHQAGCFLIPNPWDVGSARMLASLGFSALASTSAGFAWSIGYRDGAAPLEAMLGHLEDLSAAVALPVNADFGNGYAANLDALEMNVMRASATGIAGFSIEDAPEDPATPLYDFATALARVAAARRAADRGASHGEAALLTARSEGFIRGAPDIKETIKRLVAFAEAGADCLYAPGIKTPEDIAAVVKAVAPKPVNLLIGPTGLSVNQAAELGVRRISVGGALARAAWGEAQRAAKEMLESGTFTSLSRAATSAEIEKTL